MKVRTDFVTNSSSASFTIDFQLKSDRDEVVEFSMSTARDFDRTGEGEYYDGSTPYAFLFRQGWPVKRLMLNTPSEWNGDIAFGRRSLLETESLKELIADMLDYVEPELYDDEIVASDLRFFVAGDPLYYDSREHLVATIERLGGEVTDAYHADLVIYCGKERFCERWPQGYSYMEMDDAEELELSDAESAIMREMREAEAAFGDDAFTFGLHTGSKEQPEDLADAGELDWNGWILGEWNWNLFIPVLSETEFAFFDPWGPSGNGALSTMPGAVEALAEKCRQKGITRENLRIIGGKISVSPFGDSVWEVDDYTDQWGINVQTGELRSTGRQVTRWAGSLEGQGDWWGADTSWLDTAWWPFRGKVAGVPYSSVASRSVRRETVRHLDLSEFADKQVTDIRQGFKGFEDLQDLDLSCLDTSLVTDMSELFFGCERLRSLDLSSLDTSRVTDMNGMFSQCRDLLSLDLSRLDTSQVADMSGMFSYCRSLQDINLAGLDTARVTNMSNMFLYCKQLESLDLTGFDTSRVTGMSGMFEDCESLERVNLTSFDTSQVTNMSRMFSGCYKLQSLDLSGFDTSRVTSMRALFSGCVELRELDISGLDTSRADDLSSMFYNCNKLQSLDLSSFDTSQARSMYDMFARCESLEALDLSGFDTSRVTNMSGMFEGCRRIRSLDLSGFDTSKAPNMKDMFKGCDSLERWVISDSWPVERDGAIPAPQNNGAWWSEHDGRWLGVDAIRRRGRMADAFLSMRPSADGTADQVARLTVPFASVASGDVDRELVLYLDVSGLDTSQVTDMSEMFESFSTLQTLDLSRLDTSKATNMSNMFQGCRRLRSLDLTGFDTSGVTNMHDMFENCHHLERLDLTSFDTSRVTDMSGMFSRCSDLKDIDLSSFDTSQVTDMGWMFAECHYLESIDLSGFDTSQVTKMWYLFNECWYLREVDLSSFDASNVTEMRGMFRKCGRLERWTVPATWPVGLEGAIPEPTGDNGMWWSELAGAWMTVDEIRARGPMADTFTSAQP